MARKFAVFALLVFLLGGCEEKVELVRIKTRLGDILLYLYDATPKHKANFMKLAKEGYFTGTTFHRVIPNFVIQGGDPNSKDSDPANDGNGGPGYTIEAEIKPELKHKYGAVGAARDNNPEKRSSGSQFYIVTRKGGTPHLDGAYTVFGEVVSGMDVAEKIAAQPRDMNDRPNENIVMTVDIIKVKPKELAAKYGYQIPKVQSK